MDKILKIIIKLTFLSLLSATYPNIVFAEQTTALFEKKQIDQYLIEDWKNYKLMDKEALEKNARTVKLFEDTHSIATTNEQGMKLLIDLNQNMKLESIEIMQKFKPRTKEMQDLLELKIIILNFTMDIIINGLKNLETSSEKTFDQDMETIQNLITKAKTLQDEIERKVALISK